MPETREEVVIVGGVPVGPLMTIESGLVELAPEFCACTVKDAVPAVLGVPVIAPVEEFSESPAGRLPETMLHVTAPAAVRVCEYAVPTVPPGREVVVMTGTANA